MKGNRLYFIIVLVCGFCFPGMAQRSFNGSINPSATIQTVVNFTLSSNSSPTIIFSNGSDYVSGYTVSNFSTIAVKSNLPWNLYISSSTAYFSNSGIYSTPNTPASILTYGVEGKGNTVILSATSKLLNAGPNGNTSEPGNTFNISFKAQTGYIYGPGTYTISTVYTLTAQ